MNNRARIWGSMAAAALLVLIFDLISHLWGPGLSNGSITHHTWNTVESLRGWIRLMGFLLMVFLLYLERKGHPLGGYWIFYPIVRLLYDVGWMAYFGNPYPSWYIRDFGAFLVCMAPAFIIDSWGLHSIRHDGNEQTKKETGGRIELAIKIIALMTALIGLIKSLV